MNTPVFPLEIYAVFSLEQLRKMEAQILAERPDAKPSASISLRGEVFDGLDVSGRKLASKWTAKVMVSDGPGIAL